MSRIIGIDYGLVRTGIALTDELGITAQGLQKQLHQMVMIKLF